MRFCCLTGLLLLCPATYAAVPLTFCYEDKMLFPYYLGTGPVIPSQQPGASIEHLKQLVQKVPELQLELVRMPWKRCLAALKNNEVDAVIASYHPERVAFARYPMQQQQPDPRRAFAAHQTCLVSRQDAEWSWNGQQIVGSNEIVIARPLGYPAITSPVGQKFQMHYTLSGAMDVELLEKGRINAATTLCDINGQQFTASFITSRNLKVLHPPLYSNTGYLVFSIDFYQKQQALADRLWDQLALDKGSEIYQRYLNEQSQLLLSAEFKPG
jgi:polar amino acid transport system substrate-binding protein